jgi:hypothetical protein
MANRGARAALVLAVLGIGASMLVACSSNDGGDTTCDTYNSDSVDQRIAVVKKMLDDRSESTSTLHVDATRASVSAYCFVHSGDSKIANIYVG